MLVEYIKINPTSARAWWLMSLTLTDINQQMDCLRRVIHLDPKSELARERLAKLISQPPVLPSVTPFAEVGLARTEESTGDSIIVPAWAATGSVSETAPGQPADGRAVSAGPSAPTGLADMVPLPRKSKNKWWILFVLMAILAIFVIVFFTRYSSLQRQAEAQALSLQQTIAVAQTLTSLPLPTLIPTWTASPTRTPLPTATFTSTPTLTPTLQYTLTKTPRPPSLIGSVVGLFAPDFSLTDVATGQRVTLSQFDGQPVLLFFWSTVCSQCNNEIGSIETISQTYKDAGLVVLTINAAEDPASVAIFRSAHQLTFPILLDPGSIAQSAYQVNAIPRHFFVSSRGRIVFIGRGEMTLDELRIQVDEIMRPYPTATP